MIKKLSLIAGVMAVASVSTSVAAAEEAKSPHVFSANVAMTTDYIFRGISQTNDGPAIQGGFDYSFEPWGFYAGAWASNIELLPFGSTVRNRSSIEVDYFGGFSGSLANGIGWDIGGIFYYYPQQNEDSGAAGNYDYGEVLGSLSYSFGGDMEPTVDAGFAYSPDYFGEDGDSIYAHGSLGFTLPYGVGLTGTVGYLDVDGDKTTGAVGGYDYVHYSIGLSKEVSILTLTVTWNDTTDGCSDLYAGDDDLCQGVNFSVSSSW